MPRQRHDIAERQRRPRNPADSGNLRHGICHSGAARNAALREVRI